MAELYTVFDVVAALFRRLAPNYVVDARLVLVLASLIWIVHLQFDPKEAHLHSSVDFAKFCVAQLLGSVEQLHLVFIVYGVIYSTCWFSLKFFV